MEFATLGRTGLQVSRLGFGGAPIGLPGYLGTEARDSEEFLTAAKSAVVKAVEGGVNYFDTAPGYGEGRSETLLGEALEPFRKSVLIATKFPFVAGASFDDYTSGLQASLTRLRTDHVDLLQLHGGYYGEDTAEQVLTSALPDWCRRMKDRGLCRFIGITAEAPSGALERLLRSGHFDVLQMHYSLVYQATCDYQREPTGIIPLARSLGIGITTMRTATSGFLQRLMSASFPHLDEDALTGLAIQFVLSTPEVDCAIVGMKRASEVLMNVRLASDPASRFDLRELNRRTRQQSVTGSSL